MATRRGSATLAGTPDGGKINLSPLFVFEICTQQRSLLATILDKVRGRCPFLIRGVEVDRTRKGRSDLTCAQEE